MKSKKVMGRKCKNKGSNFERHISKKLSLWISKGEDDSWVWRTSSSGARAKVRSKSGKGTSNSGGDLKAENIEAFHIFKNCSWELKNGYGNYCILDVLDKNTKNPKQVEKFYIQAKEDANSSKKKYPILILKRDRSKEIILMPTKLFTLLKKKSSKDINKIKISCSGILGNSTIMVLDDFLLWCDPSFFEGI